MADMCEAADCIRRNFPAVRVVMLYAWLREGHEDRYVLRPFMIRQARHRSGRMARPAALLLIGPTGSGKTPLGDLLDREGLWHRRCCHFDFGERMRRIVAGAGGMGVPPMGGVSTGETPVGPTVKMPVPRRMGIVAGGAALSPTVVEFLRGVLASGALLEDEHFHIAEKIPPGLPGRAASRSEGPRRPERPAAARRPGGCRGRNRRRAGRRRVRLAPPTWSRPASAPTPAATAPSAPTMTTTPSAPNWQSTAAGPLCFWTTTAATPRPC